MSEPPPFSQRLYRNHPYSGKEARRAHSRVHASRETPAFAQALRVNIPIGRQAYSRATTRWISQNSQDPHAFLTQRQNL
jgi:hypothetical protein